MREDGFSDVSEMLRCGVYALLRRGVVVYIGQSRYMLTRIYTHRNLLGRKRLPEALAKVRPVAFDEVWVRPCRVEELDGLEQAMIAKYRPRYNIRHKPAEMPPEIRAMITALIGRPQDPPFNRRGL